MIREYKYGHEAAGGLIGPFLLPFPSTLHRIDMSFVTLLLGALSVARAAYGKDVFAHWMVRSSELVHASSFWSMYTDAILTHNDSSMKPTLSYRATGRVICQQLNRLESTVLVSIELIYPLSILSN